MTGAEEVDLATLPAMFPKVLHKEERDEEDRLIEGATADLTRTDH